MGRWQSWACRAAFPVEPSSLLSEPLCYTRTRTAGNPARWNAAWPPLLRCTEVAASRGGGPGVICRREVGSSSASGPLDAAGGLRPLPRHNHDRRTEKAIYIHETRAAGSHPPSSFRLRCCVCHVTLHDFRRWWREGKSVNKANTKTGGKEKGALV